MENDSAASNYTGNLNSNQGQGTEDHDLGTFMTMPMEFANREVFEMHFVLPQIDEEY